MKQKFLSRALLVGALALCAFAPEARASIFNLTVFSDPNFVPADIVPGAPSATNGGTVFTNVVGNDLTPNAIRRSPFENTVLFNTGAYSSVEGGAVAAYNMSGNAGFIFWGSVDSYNTLQFKNGGINGTIVASITGDSVPNVTTPGLGHNLILFALNSGTFDTIVLSSTTNAFEFSDLIACNGECAAIPGATPLPGALPLLASGILGFGGLVGWRKKRNGKAIAA